MFRTNAVDIDQHVYCGQVVWKAGDTRAMQVSSHIWYMIHKLYVYY